MREFFLAFISILLIGCSDYSLDSIGNEGERCFNNNTCKDPFVCEEGMCIDPDKSDIHQKDTENHDESVDQSDDGQKNNDHDYEKPDEISVLPDDEEENEDTEDPAEKRCNLGEICWKTVPTQQKRCFNDTGSTGCSSIGESFYGQDGHYAPSQSRGFENIKINDKFFVFDNLTKMLWNKKSSETELTYSEAIQFCHNLNNTYEGDKENWRLPYIHELTTLFNFDESINPAVDGFYFPDIKLKKYWTQTKLGYSSYFYVDFSGKTQFYTDAENNKNYAFCVSSDYEYDDGRDFNRWNQLTNGEITIEDRLTGLIWMKPYDDYRLWKYALQYCEKLIFAGRNDWRLPNVNELHGLANYGAYPEKQTTFPDLGTGFYWTSTTNANDINNVWTVMFKYGVLNPNMLKDKNENQIKTICVTNKE